MTRSTLSPEAVSAIISIVGILLSWIGAAFIAGYRWGTVKTRLDTLENSGNLYATKEQLAGVKEDLAEIKGMFRLALRSETHE